MQRTLVDLLAPASLSPLDPDNALLRLERAFADGVAELEQAGHPQAGALSVWDFIHRLSYLERQRAAQPAAAG